ncbi:MAG: hypothetical protein AB2A00_18395, partial [Myxococcota bacterium]
VEDWRASDGMFTTRWPWKWITSPPPTTHDGGAAPDAGEETEPMPLTRSCQSAPTSLLGVLAVLALARRRRR